MAQIEISIFFDTMIRKHTKNLTTGLSKPTTGFAQKKKKDWRRGIDWALSFSNEVERIEGTNDHASPKQLAAQIAQP